MPLETTTLSPTELLSAITSEQSSSSNASRKAFIVLYASINPETGTMWCGDCRDAEPFILKKFGNWEDVVRVVFVGSRLEWRSPQGNPWREAPYSVTGVPTIIKIQDGKWDRLVEEDVYDQAKLDAFVDA